LGVQPQDSSFFSVPSKNSPIFEQKTSFDKYLPANEVLIVF
jgi:hypothetical protein